ncbi:hypothetical protein [Bosea sp. (in: a-proteobacteria)]|uniref:hypothetical protein n=1 Tax=Bosea sp. (in: a-proteobacteria) TaxID=1871050 RepID=UPI002E167C75
MPGAAVTIILGEAQLAALDRYLRDHKPTLTREQALSEIVAAWANAQPGTPPLPADEGLRPEELNASNDT